jgi:hypothetical protein
MNRMKKFDEDEPPKPPIVDGYDFVPDKSRRSVVLSALSFIGSIGTILAVVSAVVFVAVYAARVAWKGF